MSDPWPWAVVSLAVVLIGVTKSGLGAGMGLIVVPLCAVGLGHTSRGSEATLGLLLPLLIAGDLISVWQYRRLVEPRLVTPLILPTAVGIGVGSGLLYLIHDLDDQQLVATLMRLEIGLESVVLVGLALWRERRGEAHRLMPEPWRAWLSGTFTGVSTTLAHAAGPIVALYLLPLKPDRRAFVGTTAVFFAGVNLTKVPVYVWAGQFARAELGFTARFLPLVVAGAIVGFWLNRRMTDVGFLRFVYHATFAVGVYLIVDAAVRLAARP